MTWNTFFGCLKMISSLLRSLFLYPSARFLKIYSLYAQKWIIRWHMACCYSSRWAGVLATLLFLHFTPVVFVRIECFFLWSYSFQTIILFDNCMLIQFGIRKNNNTFIKSTEIRTLTIENKSIRRMNCGIILNQMLAGGNNYIIRHFNTFWGEALRFHGLSEYYCMRQVGDVIRAYAWIKSHDFSFELLFFGSPSPSSSFEFVHSPNTVVCWRQCANKDG